MNSIIVYKGKYGATKQYAQWLAKELNIPAFSTGEVSEKYLRDSSVIVIGTSVYIGKLQVSKWLRKNVQTLKDKKLFLFLVSGTPPNEKEKLMEYVWSGVPKELMDQCDISFLHGKMIYKDLGWLDKFLLKTGARLVKSKNPAEAERMITDFNDVKKENLFQLIDLIKSSARLIS